MQERCVPAREERFDFLVQLIHAVQPEAHTILDLGCGTGSLSVRIAQAFPAASSSTRIMSEATSPQSNGSGKRVGRRCAPDRRARTTTRSGTRTWPHSAPRCRGGGKRPWGRGGASSRDCPSRDTSTRSGKWGLIAWTASGDAIYGGIKGF